MPETVGVEEAMIKITNIIITKDAAKIEYKAKDLLTIIIPVDIVRQVKDICELLDVVEYQNRGSGEND